MKYFILFLLLISGVAYGQTTYYIQADSVRFRKIGANSEFILENATRTTTGVLVNYGNGRTRFSKPRISGDTLFVGVDTILGVGSGSGVTPGIDDVLAVGQRLSANRYMSGRSNYQFQMDSLLLLVRGVYGGGASPSSYADAQMMFHPRLGAFRSGLSSGGQWDAANIGGMSVGLGQNTLASGFISTAMGNNTSATADVTFVRGQSSHAHGGTSEAGGYESEALGTISYAHGYGSFARDSISVAHGWSAIANQKYQTVFGKFNDTTNTDAIFQVGNGVQLTRVNAFEVLNDNSIRSEYLKNGGDFKFLFPPETADDTVATRAFARSVGGGGGYTNLNQFVTQTPWRLFYSNGSGDVTELAFGSSGQYLQSAGTTSVPTWGTVSGAVTIGTAGQIPFVNGGGTDFIYHPRLTFDSVGTLTVNSTFSGQPRLFVANLFGDFINGGSSLYGHARGTEAAPTALLALDAMGSDAYRAYGTTGWGTHNVVTSARMLENATDTRMGSYWTVEVTDTGSTVTSEKFRVSGIAGGRVGIKNTNPQAVLHVGGNGWFGAAAAANMNNYLFVNSTNAADNSLLNPGIVLYNNTNVFGLDVGYANTRYRTRLFTPTGGDITFSTVAANPTSQSDFTDVLTMLGSSGDVGIGTMSPSARLHLIKTTEQARIGYDGSNYYSTTVGSSGGVTFNAVGAGSLFTFSDNVIVPTAGTASGSVLTNDGTQTMTNKRWTARVGSTTSSGTPTINTDNVDIYKITALAVDITSFTTNLSGTPSDGDLLEIQITDDGTPRAITWGASFASSSVSLPITTEASTTITVILQYNVTSSYGNNTWICGNRY